MEWSDIDFDNRTLTISRSMEYRHSIGEWRIGEPKSKSGYRSIPLTDEAIDMLMNLYVHATEDEKHKEIEKIAASLKVV